VALIVSSGAQYIPDLVSTGIWGGVFLFFNSFVIAKKKWFITKFVSIIIDALSQPKNYFIITGRALNPLNTWHFAPF
jgi:hypothetical protein